MGSFMPHLPLTISFGVGSLALPNLTKPFYFGYTNLLRGGIPVVILPDRLVSFLLLCFGLASSLQSGILLLLRTVYSAGL